MIQIVRPLVSLVVGHPEDRQGATAVSGMTEYEWGTELVSALHAQLASLGLGVSTTIKPPHGTYRERSRIVVDMIEAWVPVCVVEIHFNAAPPMPDGHPDPVAWAERFRGTMGLHWPRSEAGRRLAQLCAVAVADSAGLAVRHGDGAHPQSRSWNGPPKTDEDGRHIPGGPPLYILQWTRCPAIILETHFGTSPGDHARAVAALRGGTLARDLAEAIQRWVDEHA